MKLYRNMVAENYRLSPADIAALTDERKIRYSEKFNGCVDKVFSLVRKYHENGENENSLTEKEWLFLVSCLKITNHSGKMTGKISFSSSLEFNAFCQARINCGDSKVVCTHCFSMNLQKIYWFLRMKTRIHTLILCNVLIPVKYWAKVKLTKKQKAFAETGIRIESFADVGNGLQVKNYLNFVRAFPQYRFTAWSKNWALWVNEFEKQGKPQNMTFIFSSTFIDRKDGMKERLAKWTDHRFTVYTLEYLLAHPSEITANCCTPDNSGRQCSRDCNACYHCNKTDGTPCEKGFDRIEILR